MRTLITQSSVTPERCGGKPPQFVRSSAYPHPYLILSKFRGSRGIARTAERPRVLALGPVPRLPAFQP